MADQISIQLAETVVNAGSAVTATVNFRTRATAAASTPSTIRYRVDCLTTEHALVEWTSVSAASSASIVVPGTANGTVSQSNDFEQRQITVEIDSGLSTQARATAKWRTLNVRTFDTVFEITPSIQLEPFYSTADVESAVSVLHPQYPPGHRFRYLSSFDVLDAHYYRITPAELSAGVTPTRFQYEPGDVRRYGAVGGGVTDCTTAFQSAIDVASQTSDGEIGRIVYFPGGLYKITSKLTIEANGVTLYADGVVRITGNDITSDYMLAVGGNSGSPITNNYVLGHFIWFRNATIAGGGCIEWSYSHYGTIRGSRFYNGLRPFLMHDSSGCEVDDLGFFETIAGGIGTGQYLARFHTCPQLTIKRLQNLASFSTKANTKVIIDFNCDHVQVYGLSVGQILLTRTGVGGTFAPRWVAIDSCYGESAEEIASFDFQYCKSVKIAKCHGAVGSVGANFAANALGVHMSECTFLDNDLDGVLIQGGSYIQIEDCDISSNNASGRASISGIRMSGDCDHIEIRRNRIKNHLASGNTHGHGILTTGGTTVDHLTIEDNDIADHTTAAITDNAAATNKIVRRNKGYVTENSGTSSITSGSTNVDVTHGLSITPDATKIIVNFTEQGTNDYGRVWISNITSTQFRVNVSADPGGSNLDFSWRVVS